jgi:hypothetical protein
LSTGVYAQFLFWCESTLWNNYLLTKQN